MNGRKDEKGIVLVLALVLLGVISAVGIGVSLLVIQEVQSTTRIGESIVATYAAEAKIEYALARITEYRDIPGLTLNEALNGNATITGVKHLGGPIAIGASNATVDLNDSDVGEEFFLTTLNKNESIQLDVQPDACFLDYTDASCVRYISFSGQGLDSTSGVAPWLEVTDVAFSAYRTQETTVVKTLFSESQFSNPADPALHDLKGQSPLTFPAEVQNVRFTALYNGVKNMEIKAYTGNPNTPACSSGACDSDVLGRIVINSVATYAKSHIGISASVPWKLPPSGLFDFALFSEETVQQD